jgi:two-component system cell cycle response regulator
MSAARVLVIDDSPEIHTLLAVRLRAEDVVLLRADDATSGLAAAIDDPPDLILLDVELPDGTGFDVCSKLKEDPRTRAVPVMFLTGNTDIVTKVRGFDIGGIDYVTKPFEAHELRARVRSALRTKRFQDLLANRAQIDALSGLWNRSYLDRRLGEEVGAARRYGRVVSLMMCDIDHFKSVNDRFGHPFGDRVIQGVADVLGASLRGTDAACRYGGEEFALILTEVDAAQAHVAADRILNRVRELRFHHPSGPVGVTVSLGIACTDGFESADLTPGALITAADEALYAAKRNGRDQILTARRPVPAP